MGGTACIIKRYARLPAESVPTDPAKLPAWDANMRQLMVDISEDIALEAPDKVKHVCNTLAKSSWAISDRTSLLDIVEALYASMNYG